ncbi:tetratricopeptide repeat protein 38 [Pyrus ussuriensis x Pyrus communis]|uniref:Tetratricopeptide repeat protein 38 n=1 Tax=Pyrus ussuriensis x Pyrus communis TaxID=2448454 RepID=A0A5N5H9D6_9ROSA|nr:tetratricopeptide repeat protein 38 [Pyrus ussuriensis x Pyrus communis]
MGMRILSDPLKSGDLTITFNDLPSSSTIFTLIFQFTGKRKQNPVLVGVAGPVLSKKLCSFDRRGVERKPQLATGSWKMEAELKVDKFGYEVRTSSDACVSAINAFYDQVLNYRRRPSVILEAAAHDDQCVLANILAAYFLSSDPSQAPSHLQAAKSRLEQATPYEKAVFDAVNCLISKDRDDDVAFELHSKLLKSFPRDLASLQRAQVLPSNEQEDFVYGMLAFPLLELGRMEEAEKAAKKGYEINKRDCWVQHNFMEECSPSWDLCSSFMFTHNWWHVALCYLEGHVYLNALGLLLRVHVRGEMDAFEDHLKTLANCVTDQANWYLEWHLDVLILWALSCTGEISKAEELLKGLKSRIAKMNKKKQQFMQKAMLLAEATYEYGKGNEKQALELLGPEFDADNCKMIGASAEQIDIFNEVWYCMLLNNGQAAKAIEVLKKRIKSREGIPFLWRLLERSYKLTGRDEEAATASEEAKRLENAYFP